MPTFRTPGAVSVGLRGVLDDLLERRKRQAILQELQETLRRVQGGGRLVSDITLGEGGQLSGLRFAQPESPLETANLLSQIHNRTQSGLGTELDNLLTLLKASGAFNPQTGFTTQNVPGLTTGGRGGFFSPEGFGSRRASLDPRLVGVLQDLQSRAFPTAQAAGLPPTVAPAATTPFVRPPAPSSSGVRPTLRAKDALTQSVLDDLQSGRATPQEFREQEAALASAGVDTQLIRRAFGF